MKKEELNYFDEFLKMAKFSMDITDTLKSFVLSYNYTLASENENKVHEKENEADKTQHAILNYLVKDFVPPIDREDIFEMTKMLDDVVDCIDEVAINFNILNATELREDVPTYVDLLKKATSKLYDLLVNFKDLKDYDKVKKSVIEINDIEEQADELYQKSIKELYTNEKDAINVIRWTTIYNNMENCFDSIEHLSETVNATFIKNE